MTRVQDLIRNDGLRDDIAAMLKRLPDLERLISRLHAMGIGRDKSACESCDVF